eukprot:scaffold8080_cov417-Prasinococcus_capsulatus_cf.AAC.1
MRQPQRVLARCAWECWQYGQRRLKKAPAARRNCAERHGAVPVAPSSAPQAQGLAEASRVGRAASPPPRSRDTVGPAPADTAPVAT